MEVFTSILIHTHINFVSLLSLDIFNGPTVPPIWPYCPCKCPYCPIVKCYLYKNSFNMESFWECFGNVYTHFYTCTLILLCLVGLHVFQWPCLSLEMALPVPQNGPTVPSVIFFSIKSIFIWKVFGSVLEVFIHIFIHVHSFCYV